MARTRETSTHRSDTSMQEEETHAESFAQSVVRRRPTTSAHRRHGHGEVGQVAPLPHHLVGDTKDVIQ